MIAARRLFRILSTVSFLLLGQALLTQALLAQEPAPPGRWSRLFQDTTEVNVVNVEVFVTDAKGQPIQGLGKDDFELMVDGEAVLISNFYAVEGGEVLELAAVTGGEPAEAAEAVPPPVEDRRLRLVIYVDNVNISPRSRKQIFRGVREHLLANPNGDARYMLVSRDERSEAPPNVRQDFTDSTTDIVALLDGMENESTQGSRFQTERRQILRDMENIDVDDAFGTVVDPDEVREQLAREAETLFPRIVQLGQQQNVDLRSSIHVLDQLLGQLASLPGRKALLYVSDGLELRPSEGLLETFENYFAPLGEIQVNIRSELDRLDLTPQMNRVLDRASSNRVAFYTLNAATSASMSRGSAEFAGDSAGSMASTGLGFGEASRREGLVMMAERTGGRASLGRGNFGVTLAGLFNDHRNHYSLGFTSDAEPGKKRRIEVRVNDRSLQVRHRLSFREKTPTEEMSERVLSALAVHDDGDNPLAIKVRSEDETPHDGNFVVPVLVEVPLGKLVLVPGEKEHEASVSMYVAARDDKGRTSGVTRHACPVRIPNAEILTAMGKSMVCGVRLMMREGPQEVAVVVRDEIAGNASTARMDLDVGAEPVIR